MRRYLLLPFVLPIVALAMVQDTSAARLLDIPSADYGPAAWIPASSANYSVADRPHDYPIDMIVIHDIEGSYATAIQMFQDPARQASSHYVIGRDGQVAQMVAEKDIAWHAGNWDYNTRSIGIEHEGFAYINGTFTTPMYQASERLIASICSRWGVPIDRQHVIGHNEVPDPDNPGLFGGSDHHTDPGPYWHWDNYIRFASEFANALPSPPRMVLSAIGVSHDSSVALSWPAARTCHLPIAEYQITGQPGNIAFTLPGSATSTTIAGLQNGTTYAFTVTARNADGQDSVTSNPVIPMTVPNAPTNVVAAPAGGSAIVRWTAPSYNGGGTITGYVVTPYVNGVAGNPVRFNRRSTMQVISNLTNGATYTFTVAAINAAGTGAASNPSNAVSPSAALRQAPAQSSDATPPARSTTNQSSPAPSPPPR